MCDDFDYLSLSQEPKWASGQPWQDTLTCQGLLLTQMHDPTLMSEYPRCKKYRCNWQVFETASDAGISHTKFTVNTVLGILRCNSIALRASLLQTHRCHQTQAFRNFHAIFKWKSKALPFLSSTFSHITLENFPVSSQTPFLAAPPKIFSLATRMLPGSHKIWFSVLLPAQGSLTQHSQ